LAAGLDDLARLPGVDHVVAITESDALLGAMTLAARGTGPLPPRDLRLAADVANAAGLLLRAVELDDRLRERIRLEADQAAALDTSRRRLIAARDEAREQLGREIQAEVCGALEHCAEVLGTLADPPGADGALTRAVSTLSVEVDQAITGFRRLVRGVYPATLTDHGLGPALENLAADLPLPATVTGPPLPRFPARVEACAYFCLSSLLRSWPGDRPGRDGGRVVIAPRVDGGDLVVSVTGPTDGSGSASGLFDPLVLESALDRVAALDGALMVGPFDGGLSVVLRLPTHDVLHDDAHDAPAHDTGVHDAGGF
jgi:hypothetical protein